MKSLIALAAVCGLYACGSGEPAPSRVQRVEQPVTQPAVSAPEAPAAEKSVVDPTSKQWEKVTLEDSVPLCVFADHDERAKAPFLKDVRKQALRANSSLVFGAFAPGCVSEACDSPPSLQCQVSTEEPNTLVVRSKLWYEHARGTTCTTECRSVIAGCETKALAAGKYTVKYGERSFSLRVPSVVRTPCFAL